MWCVLSGGGGEGAFQVGALYKYIIEDGVKYEGFAGTSIGAVNAAFIAQYHDQAKGVADLLNLWLAIRGTKDIYRRWYRGLLWELPLLWKPSRFSSAPLRALLAKHLKVPSVVPCFACSVDLATKRSSGLWAPRGDTNTEEDLDTWRRAVEASAAFPTILEPVNLFSGGVSWAVDGGAVDYTPIGAAIGVEAEAIQVIMCSGTGYIDAAKSHPRPPSTINVALQSIAAALDEVLRNDIQIAQLINDLARYAPRVYAHYRLVDLQILQPPHRLSRDAMGGGAGEGLNPAQIRKNIRLGYECAGGAGSLPLNL